jgi:ribonuclease HII
MKFKTPDFMENVATPVEGEVAMRKYAATAYGPGTIVVGIDEVGRGPMAGPVVACAAVLKSPDILPVLNDSKKFTRPKREAIYDKVKDACECFAIASASVEEIDTINILEADFLAMRRALQALGMPGLAETDPELPVEVRGQFPSKSTVLVAVDGNLKIKGLDQQCQIPVVKGDGLVASISAASILAKVFRDRYMDQLALKYPGYGFEKHAGYGTEFHKEAIRKLGLSPVHRKTFRFK